MRLQQNYMLTTGDLFKMKIPSIFKPLWGKEYSLVKTFWLFGILSFPIAAAIYASANTVLLVLMGFSSLTVHIFTTPIVIIYNAYLVFFSICLIRISHVYNKNNLWKYSAMLFALFPLAMGCINVFDFTKAFIFYIDLYNMAEGRGYRGSLLGKILGWALIIGIMQIIGVLYRVCVNHKNKKTAAQYSSEDDEEYEDDEYEDEETNT